MFNESFPQIEVKTSSRDPPYMSPLVKYLCNIRNKQINTGENTDLQERINKHIRKIKFVLCGMKTGSTK